MMFAAYKESLFAAPHCLLGRKHTYLLACSYVQEEIVAILCFHLNQTKPNQIIWFMCAEFWMKQNLNNTNEEKMRRNSVPHKNRMAFFGYSSMFVCTFLHFTLFVSLLFFCTITMIWEHYELDDFPFRKTTNRVVLLITSPFLGHCDVNAMIGRHSLYLFSAISVHTIAVDLVLLRFALPCTSCAYSSVRRKKSVHIQRERGGSSDTDNLLHEINEVFGFDLAHFTCIWCMESCSFIFFARDF